MKLTKRQKELVEALKQPNARLQRVPLTGTGCNVYPKPIGNVMYWRTYGPLVEAGILKRIELPESEPRWTNDRTAYVLS